MIHRILSIEALFYQVKVYVSNRSLTPVYFVGDLLSPKINTRPKSIKLRNPKYIPNILKGVKYPKSVPSIT